MGVVRLLGESEGVRELSRVGREGGGERGRAGERGEGLGRIQPARGGFLFLFPFSFPFSFLNLFFLFSKYSSKFPRCPK
jgi:hypothetical protein